MRFLKRGGVKGSRTGELVRHNGDGSSDCGVATGTGPGHLVT